MGERALAMVPDTGLPVRSAGASVEATGGERGEVVEFFEVSEVFVADDAAVAADPLVGRTIDGRFKIVQRIGAGGMGRVYRAVQSPLEREVALKVVIPNYGGDLDPSFYRRFFLEASVTAKLKHPNTITIFDYGKTEDGLVYIAMEYVHGRTLSELVATEGPLSPERAVHIAAQVARSLREAHALGVMHRDLKPANVMLQRHGEDDWFVKVLDFGLVKFFAGAQETSPDAEELTTEGAFVGSPKFMAPEQAGKRSDHRADIYSLGVLLWYMLAGRPPFVGETVAETILMHMRQPVPPIPAPPERPVPADLAAVVYKCMAKKPEDRFQSMQEVIDALRRCAVGELSGRHSGRIGGAPVGLAPPPLPRKRSLGDSASGQALLEAIVEIEPSRPLAADAAAPKPPTATPASSARVWILSAAGVGVAAAMGVAWMVLSSPAPAPVAVPAPGRAPSAPAPKPALAPAPAAAPTTPTVPAEPMQPEPTAAPPAPEPPTALFRVRSEPEGAQVLEGGELIGVTPLDLVRPVQGGAATVKLRVAMRGYEPLDVEDSSTAGEKVVYAKLRKIDHRRPPPPRPAPRAGYKDDPY